MDSLTAALQRRKRRRQLPPPVARRQLRERLGLTQEDIAEALGVDRASISRYEAGEIRLDIVQLRTICQALGLSLLEFIHKYENALR